MTYDKNNPPKSNKTPHVMRLVSGTTRQINPLVDKEFQRELLRTRMTAQHELDAMQRELEQQKAQLAQNPSGVVSDEPVVINVIQSLVEDMLPIVLERFKCCRCSRCRSEIMLRVLKRLPAEFASVSDEYTRLELNKLKIKHYKIVLQAIIRAIVDIKNEPLHK